MALSFKPRDMVAGGGLIDDVDVTLRNCRFQFYDYGKGGKIPPAFVADLELPDGETQEQVWTCGDATKIAPSMDGKTAVPHPELTPAPYLVALGEKGLTNTSNFGMFVTSLIACGFPEDDISDRADGLDGLKIHIVRKERPKIQKAQDTNPFNTGGGQQDRALEVIIASKILERPGGKKAAPAPKAPKAATPTAPAADAIDAATAVQGHILAILTNPKYAGGLPKASLATEMFALVKSEKNAAELLKLCIQDETLKNGPWTYEGGVLKLG